jgi:hypothetical protein
VGWALTALGAVLFLAAYGWAGTGPPDDANIGAGVLAVIGIALFGVGILWLVCVALIRFARFARRFVKPC